MKILFGQMDVCSGCDCGQAEGAFICPHSNDAFYYSVEMNDIETFSIMDTCNRYVPFDLENLEPLIFALQTLRDRTSGPISDYERASAELKELKIATY